MHRIPQKPRGQAKLYQESQDRKGYKYCLPINGKGDQRDVHPFFYAYRNPIPMGMMTKRDLPFKYRTHFQDPPWGNGKSNQFLSPRSWVYLPIRPSPSYAMNPYTLYEQPELAEYYSKGPTGRSYDQNEVHNVNNRRVKRRRRRKLKTKENVEKKSPGAVITKDGCINFDEESSFLTSTECSSLNQRTDRSNVAIQESTSQSKRNKQKHVPSLKALVEGEQPFNYLFGLFRKMAPKTYILVWGFLH